MRDSYNAPVCNCRCCKAQRAAALYQQLFPEPPLARSRRVKDLAVLCGYLAGFLRAWFPEDVEEAIQRGENEHIEGQTTFRPALKEFIEGVLDLAQKEDAAGSRGDER